MQNTLTAGQGPIPTRPAIISHDACEGGVALKHVACFTVERHCGAQFVVTAQPCAVHHVAWVEAWLPELGFMTEGNRYMNRILHYTVYIILLIHSSIWIRIISKLPGLYLDCFIFYRIIAVILTIMVPSLFKKGINTKKKSWKVS